MSDEIRKLVGEFNGRLARLYSKLKSPLRGPPSFSDELPWVKPPRAGFVQPTAEERENSLENLLARRGGREVG